MVSHILPNEPHWEHFVEKHLHSAQEVAPSGAAPVALTSGVGLWTLGNFSAPIIAADTIASPFDLHWAINANADSNVWYEIVFYYGGSDIECARISFSRTNPFTNSVTLPIQTIVLPANSQVRAKMMDTTGGAQAEIKVLFHRY